MTYQHTASYGAKCKVVLENVGQVNFHSLRESRFHLGSTMTESAGERTVTHAAGVAVAKPANFAFGRSGLNSTRSALLILG
jgi:hypothetical protein